MAGLCPGIVAILYFRVEFPPKLFQNLSPAERRIFAFVFSGFLLLLLFVVLFWFGVLFCCCFFFLESEVTQLAIPYKPKTSSASFVVTVV